MRFRIATLLTLIFALIFPTTLFAANPKAGATCSKAGLTQTYAGKKFTCIKSGKKLVWDKGALTNTSPIPKSSPTTSTVQESSSNIVDWSKTFSTDNGFKYLFNNPCQKEENIATQWQELQDAYFKYSNCIWPINVAKYTLGTVKPKTILSSNEIMDSKICAISEPANSNYHRGFMNNWPQDRVQTYNLKKVPGPSMNIQVIPIYSEDTAKPLNSPEKDYSRFLNFIVDWAGYSSDQGSSIRVNFPKEYIKFSGKITDYKVFHESRHDSPEHIRFNKDVIKQVDPYINFEGINLAIIVVPFGTDGSVLSQGSLGPMVTNEGVVPTSGSQFPYVLKDFGSLKFKNLMLPYWWLHELYHSGFGIEHHDGDGLNDVNQEYGMGAWSLMSHGGGDLLAWDKWLIGFISDSQVQCVSNSQTSTTWVTPSSVKSTRAKLTVVPISEFKVIAIESIRPAGLYYKLPKSSTGVLVYEIDLTKNFLETGMKLALPTNRDANKGPFFLAEAPLREGESVITNGFKISVIESGNFGDVVKVEKA